MRERGNLATRAILIALALLLVAIAALSLADPGLAAENLSLRKGISFDEDLDVGFPIVADKMDDTAIQQGMPALLFFGASGDLNTNRQAKRLVSLYNHFGKKGIKFIVIDVDHPANKEARQLIKAHYKGYIPCQVVIDREGKSAWNKVGEVAEKLVAAQLEKVMATER